MGSTLNDLVAKGLLVRFRKGHKIMYKMRKTKPPYGGWEIPWIDFMMTRKDWKRKWKRVDAELKMFRSQKDEKLAKQKIRDLICEKLIEPNPELVKVLEEIDMDVPLTFFREHMKTPYCLECLRANKTFVKTEFHAETKEFICPECGIVAETTSFV